MNFYLHLIYNFSIWFIYINIIYSKVLKKCKFNNNNNSLIY